MKAEPRRFVVAVIVDTWRSDDENDYE